MFHETNRKKKKSCAAQQCQHVKPPACGSPYWPVSRGLLPVGLRNGLFLVVFSFCCEAVQFWQVVRRKIYQNADSVKYE